MTLLGSQKKFRQVAAGFLAAAILFTNFPVAVFADELSPEASTNVESSGDTLSSSEGSASEPEAPTDESGSDDAALSLDEDASESGDITASSITVGSVSLDVRVNGSNGSITIAPTETYTYSWTSDGATSCELTAPAHSSITLDGSDGPIGSGHAWFPATGSSVTLTITCIGGSTSVSESVTVNVAAPVSVPTIDIKANAQDGTVTLASGETYTYSWTSNNANTCTLTSPTNSSITLDGSDGPIGPGHAWYPAAGGQVTLTITCASGSQTATDSVTVALPATPGAMTVDIKANGSDGPITINSGDTYTYTWTSSNANPCNLTSPTNSSITLDGSDGPIGVGHAWYPTASSSVTLTIVCANTSTSTVTDSVTVNLAAPGAVTVDVKANGSDGPVVLAAGETYTYTWVSTGANTCTLTSPSTSSITLNGSDGPIGDTHAWYPAAGGTVTITVTCVNGSSTDTDSVVISRLGVSAIVTADIKANGSDGPVTINSGDTYTYTWTSNNANTCTLTSPTNSSITLDGSDGPIGPGHAWYPGVGSPTTLTIVCTNGSSTATDSVVVNLATGCPVPVITSGLSVSTEEDEGFSYTITATGAGVTFGATGLPSWLSFNATTGVLSGTPSDQGTFNVTISASNICGLDTRTLVINVDDDNGGGGSSRRRGGSNRVNIPDAPEPGPSCLYIKEYMRRDFQNDPIEVMRLQAFLQVFEGASYVTINGVYDDATIAAVNAFQTKYANDILTPWGHTAPTSYVYILTLKKVNELYCLNIFPLSEAQAREIVAFKELLSGLRARGIPVDSYTQGGPVVIPAGTAEGTGTATSTATTTVDIPVVGVLDPEDSPQGQNSGLAAALFAAPDNIREGLQCIYEFLLILIVLYILASVLEDVLYKDEPQNVLKRFFTKWIAIALGLVIAIFVAYFLNEWCLILPLLIALLLTLIWMALYPKQSSLRASAKSWYMVINARGKSMVGKKTENPVLVVEEKK